MTEETPGPAETIARKTRRMEAARRRRRDSAIRGVAMFGMVGWSVAAPILLGAAVGRWIDAGRDGGRSWTLALLLAGAALGAFNAWRWVMKEGRDD